MKVSLSVFSRPVVTLAGLLLALVFSPTSAQAQWGAEVRGHMGFGGDEVANVTYTDGSDSNLKLGTYFSFSAGPIFEAWSSGENKIELQGMVGWAGWSTGPENTEDRLSLNRFPLDAMAYYARGFPERDMLFRIGGGMTYHLIGGVGGSGSLDAVEMGIENAAGAVAEVTAVFGILSGGIRYTRMNNALDQVSASLDGSSVGLYLGLTTPRF
ncbi:MAG: hypothetical protein ACR2QM_14625 [Longimicrobiales bacterium]